MFSRIAICIVISLTVCAAAETAPIIEPLQPYALPAEVAKTIDDAARQNDVLLLGEWHGTQEVPAIAVALLPSLTKLGYHALALEAPRDQQSHLNDWALGKTESIPEFFAHPSTGGRGNVQALSLIRIAVSPPYELQLICFDLSKPEWEEHLAEYRRIDEKKNKTPAPSDESNADGIKNWQQRDASMASHLVKQHRLVATPSKILAICGGSHARIANKRPQMPEFKQLWPSFAAILQRDNPQWNVGSINIELHEGGYFSYGRINELHGPKIEKMEMRRIDDGDWNWELHLPRATPGTFLAPPSGL